MTDIKQTSSQATAQERCDIKVWSDSCRKSEYTSNADKYLCTSCGSISALDHEMHHEHFPHLSGDKDTLY
ncbi:MAG: hypothetical protein A2075_20480 [Geobacteraceae bacterium GWC2_58_44]|nr:MAG: hypothetical protein A2075_20480 [Geobacteraceae bacterium GWC2_58_44]HBG05542.1 hypothetical protein [Geobacter sp.]